MKTKLILALVFLGQLAFAQVSAGTPASDSWNVEMNHVDDFNWNSIPSRTGEAILLNNPPTELDLSLPEESFTPATPAQNNLNFNAEESETTPTFQFSNSGGVEGAVRSVRNLRSGVNVWDGCKMSVKKFRPDVGVLPAGVRRPPSTYMLTLNCKK